MKININILFLIVVFLLSSNLWASVTVSYAYDDLNRVKQVVRSDGPSLVYIYDEVGNITKSTSENPDSDGDGLVDIAEINIYLTNTLLIDSDGDTLSDGDEVNTFGTDPILADTDADGFNDDVEISAGSDPTNDTSTPSNFISVPMFSQWNFALLAILMLLVGTIFTVKTDIRIRKL